MSLRITCLSGLAILAACAAPAPVANPPPPANWPVIDGVDLHPSGTPAHPSVAIAIHFHAPAGDVQSVRRVITATSHAELISKVTMIKLETRLHPSVAVGIDPDVQKLGATFTSTFECGHSKYYVTLRATLVTASGFLSNSTDYTIHCNGG